MMKRHQTVDEIFWRLMEVLGDARDVGCAEPKWFEDFMKET